MKSSVSFYAIRRKQHSSSPVNFNAKMWHNFVFLLIITIPLALCMPRPPAICTPESVINSRIKPDENSPEMAKCIGYVNIIYRYLFDFAQSELRQEFAILRTASEDKELTKVLDPADSEFQKSFQITEQLINQDMPNDVDYKTKFNFLLGKVGVILEFDRALKSIKTSNDSLSDAIAAALERHNYFDFKQNVQTRYDAFVVNFEKSLNEYIDTLSIDEKASREEMIEWAKELFKNNVQIFYKVK